MRTPRFRLQTIMIAAAIAAAILGLWVQMARTWPLVSHYRQRSDFHASLAFGPCDIPPPLSNPPTPAEIAAEKARDLQSRVRQYHYLLSEKYREAAWHPGRPVAPDPPPPK